MYAFSRQVPAYRPVLEDQKCSTIWRMIATVLKACLGQMAFTYFVLINHQPNRHFRFFIIKIDIKRNHHERVM